jgi:hypothetical protein
MSGEILCWNFFKERYLGRSIDIKRDVSKLVMAMRKRFYGLAIFSSSGFRVYGAKVFGLISMELDDLSFVN